MNQSASAPPVPTSKLGIWWLASRPRSLTATYIPVALGGVVAWQEAHFHLFHFLLASLGALFLQISANWVNEYFDHARGSDKEKKQGLGMIIARGLMTPRDVFIGAVVTLLIGCLIGLYFVAVTGLTILYIGIAGVLAVILYSSGPLPLSELGLGEITVFVLMGPALVFGVYFVQAESYSALPLWASIPSSFLVANIMHANNLRDLEADKAKNKRTLAVTFGRKFAQDFFMALCLGAFVSTVLLVIAGIAPIFTLASLIFLPQAWGIVKTATSTTDVPTLHGVLIRTAQLHKQFGFVFVVAWVIWLVIEKII